MIEVEPLLEDGERKIVLVTQDESTFHAHDARNRMWKKEGEQILRKKGPGKGLMVSNFMCPCHGTVCYQDFGKNSQGYWTNSHMQDQLKLAVRLFEEMHPSCQGLFIFDQSSNHGALSEDALRATTMNLGPGGKQPKMRDGYFLKDEVRVVQSMQFEDGTPKGLKQVLSERGLWHSGLRVESARDLMGLQPDFQEQKSSLADLVERAGHLADFYPKYHCELNFIERVWAETKGIVRKECLFNFPKMKTQVSETVKSIPIHHVRRYYRRAFRYLDAYYQGLNGPMVEWAVKRYRGHRKVKKGLDDFVDTM